MSVLRYAGHVLFLDRLGKSFTVRCITHPWSRSHWTEERRAQHIADHLGLEVGR